MRKWSEKTETAQTRMVKTAGLPVSTFYHWKERYGKANEHNAQVPRDHWLEPSEKEAILGFHAKYPLEGYRRGQAQPQGHGLRATAGRPRALAYRRLAPQYRRHLLLPRAIS